MASSSAALSYSFEGYIALSLAISSCFYSKTIYPQGVYLPAFLYLETKSNEYTPHPRERMSFYLEANGLAVEDVTAVVKIRKANHMFAEYEKSRDGVR